LNRNREDKLRRLSDVDWDLVIVGGGITGAGILREAARRHLKAALLEQRDFAWGTSSRSGQLVHGGLRYLTQGHVRLTYQCVRERQNLMQELPGLVDCCDLMMANYRQDGARRFVVHAALLVYDLMSHTRRKHLCSFRQLADTVPGLNQKDLVNGLLFYESITDDARLVLRVLDQAVQDGGIAMNYCRVNDLLTKDGRVCGVRAEDGETGEKHEVRAKQVISATGAWADRLRRRIGGDATKRMRPLRGSHLVFSAERIPITQSVVLTHPVSKRPGFLSLWQGRILAGNTDIDHEGNLDDEAAITPTEVEYLLENVRHHFPDLQITEHDAISSWSGVRPVIDSGAADPSRESRDHAVWNENGLLTVTGGKLTTFRVMALDVLKAAQSSLGAIPNLNLSGAIFAPFNRLAPIPKGLDRERLRRIEGRYGARATELINAAEDGELEPIQGTHTLWAELRWAAANEAVVHLEDLMLRRSRLGVLLEEGGKAQLPRIRAMCQPLLGWSDARWEQEERDYLGLWRRCYSLPGARADAAA
jgi:glycerol-3-phosphate dehydrogenase